MKKVFIDAMPLVDPKLSGIGHTILQTIRALEQDADFMKIHQLILLVPFTKKGSMAQWGFKSARERVYPFPGRILAKAEAWHILPPLDLVFGRGTYLFMNFKNWPLTPWSRSVTYVHDVAFALYPQYVQPKNQRYLTQNVPRWAKRSTSLVTVSKASAKELADYLPAYAPKIHVVYNGVDTDDFYARPNEQITAVRQRYDITSPYICFLSTIEPRKNLDVLISAMEQLQAAGSPLSLFIIGGFKGWLNEDIFAHIDRARAAGCKIVIPDVYVPDEDLPALLSGAKMLVHPAFHEGFGISPLQAMACSTPVIAADIPVLHEVIGDAGTYFDPTDPTNLREKILALQSGSSKNKARLQKGVARARQFSWKHAEEQLRPLL